MCERILIIQASGIWRSLHSIGIITELNQVHISKQCYQKVCKDALKCFTHKKEQYFGKYAYEMKNPVNSVSSLFIVSSVAFQTLMMISHALKFKLINTQLPQTGISQRTSTYFAHWLVGFLFTTEMTFVNCSCMSVNCSRHPTVQPFDFSYQTNDFYEPVCVCVNQEQTLQCKTFCKETDNVLAENYNKRQCVIQKYV